MNASINMYSQSRLDVMAPGLPSLLKVYIASYLFYIMFNFGVCNSGKIPCVSRNILNSMGIDWNNNLYYKSSHKLPNTPICPDQWMPDILSSHFTRIGSLRPTLHYECKVGHSDPIPVKCKLNISCKRQSIHIKSQVEIQNIGRNKTKINRDQETHYTSLYI